MGLMDWNTLNTNAQQGDFGAALAGYGAGADRVSQGFTAGKQLGDDLNKEQARSALANVYAAGDNHDAHNAAMMANSTGLAYADPQQIEGLRLFGMGGDTHANSAATTANTQALTAGTQADTQKKNLLMPLVVPHEQANIGLLKGQTAEAYGAANSHNANAAFTGAQTNRFNQETPYLVANTAMDTGRKAMTNGDDVQNRFIMNGGKTAVQDVPMTGAINNLNRYMATGQGSVQPTATTSGGGGYTAPTPAPARMASTNAPSDPQQSVLRIHPTPQQALVHTGSGGSPRAAALQSGVQTPTVNATAPTPTPPMTGGNGLSTTTNGVSNGAPLQAAAPAVQDTVVGNNDANSNLLMQHIKAADNLAQNGSALDFSNFMHANPEIAKAYDYYYHGLKGAENNNIVTNTGDFTNGKFNLSPDVLTAGALHYKKMSDASDKTQGLLALTDNLDAIRNRGIDVRTLLNEGKITSDDVARATALVGNSNSEEGRIKRAQFALLAHDQQLNPDTEQWTDGAIMNRAAKLGLVAVDKDGMTMDMRQKEYDNKKGMLPDWQQYQAEDYKKKYLDPNNFHTVTPDYSALRAEREQQSREMNLLGNFFTKAQILKNNEDRGILTKVPDNFQLEYQFIHMSPKEQQAFLDQHFNYDASKVTPPKQPDVSVVPWSFGDTAAAKFARWRNGWRGFDMQRDAPLQTGRSGTAKAEEHSATK